MDETLPFLQDSAGGDRSAPERPARDRGDIRRTAARMAAEVDRALALSEPAPDLPSAGTGPTGEPAHVAGTTRLPFHSVPVDPAGLAGAQTRETRGLAPRVLECVACEYDKLETRLAPGRYRLDTATLTPEQRQHVGPGERDYTLCKSCHDASGHVPTPLYARWAAERDRESPQRTFRSDPRFAELAERVAEVDRWRRGIGAQELTIVGPERRVDAAELTEYDGLSQEDRVHWLTDFTEQRAPEGQGRKGTPDPEFASHAFRYDPPRIGTDEIEAHLENDRWEAHRREAFRRAWERTGDIEDPMFRRTVRERLVERWDPRMVLVGEDRMALANPFAEVRAQRTPYARSAAHSGVDEGLAGEPEWRRGALARHEASVREFLAEARLRLAGQGVPLERIKELTTLPELNPGREIGKEIHAAPLHVRAPLEPQLVSDPSRLPADRAPTLAERIAALRRPHRPLTLAPAAELDAVAAEARSLDFIPDVLNSIGIEEAARGRVDSEAVLGMAERTRQRLDLHTEIREADAAREAPEKHGGALRRADAEVQGATRGFASEIRATFRDPAAFQAAFRALDEPAKRAALRTLRESPEDFARGFGPAGALRVRGGDAERRGVLAASAGERYLDAVQAREITRKHAAREMDLPPEASLKEVRQAAAGRLADATARRTRAVAAREALGRTPSLAELARAYGALQPAERTRVLSAVPELRTLLRPGRQVARSGPSL